MLFAFVLTCTAAAELYCEVDGHVYDFDWSLFWEEYNDGGTDSVCAVCIKCLDDFIFDAEVSKKVKPATVSADGSIVYTAYTYEGGTKETVNWNSTYWDECCHWKVDK